MLQDPLTLSLIGIKQLSKLEHTLVQNKVVLKPQNSKTVPSNAHVTYKVNCMSHKQLPQNEPNHHKKCQKWPIYLSHKMMTLVLSQLIPSIHTVKLRILTRLNLKHMQALMKGIFDPYVL